MAHGRRLARQRQRLTVDEEWIRSGLHQGNVLPRIRERGVDLRGRLRQQRIRNLIHLLRIRCQVGSFSSDVGRGDEEIRRQIPFEIEIPLLYVGLGMIVGIRLRDRLHGLRQELLRSLRAQASPGRI